jgi:hypothetical protein
MIVSRITDFTRGEAPDSDGRMIADVWAFSDRELESVHDFMHWLFPLREANRFHPDAPPVDDDDVRAFRTDPDLRAGLLRSFDVYLAFLGLVREGDRVVPAPDYGRKKSVFRQPNHNWLRITRVLASARMLGLEAESRALLDFLRAFRETIDPTTFRDWEEAARG